MTVQALNGLALAHGRWVNQPVSQGRRLLVVNLMPTKEATELQFLNLLARTKVDCQVGFAYPVSHHFRYGDAAAIKRTYWPLSIAFTQPFDGVIVTGAPVEQLAFPKVDYWAEFTTLVQWLHHHHQAVVYECWASQAALHVRYGWRTQRLAQKLFGIYQTRPLVPTSRYFQNLGAGGVIRMPQSRHTRLQLPAQLPADLTLLAKSDEVEAFLLTTQDQRELFITGHPEYARDTLAREYARDLARGLAIQAPQHYYRPGTTEIAAQWQATSTLLYTNWLSQL